MKKFNKILNQIHEPLNFSDESGTLLLSNLVGETIGDEWELIDSRETTEPIDVTHWITDVNLESIKQDANADSRLDKNEFKVRYSYSEKHSSTNSRTFCREMMSRTNSGVVYRHEDIVQASFQGINKSHGHKGKPYSLFKYKGGVNCHHVWKANLYRLKTKGNGEFVDDKSLSSSEEIQSADTWYTPKPDGLKESIVAPRDMTNRGHHPDWKP